jgi:hypothetical protein
MGDDDSQCACRDVKFQTAPVRKDGKRTGQLANPKRSITKGKDKGGNMLIYLELEQAGERSIDLTKLDDDTRKGQVLSAEATPKHIR